MNATIPGGLPTARWTFGLVTALWAALLLVRLGAPDDLMSFDQERQASYALDVLHNGRWVVQRDMSGDVTSKPPLYTWITASVATLAGGLDRLVLTFPSWMAVLGQGWAILLAGSLALGRGVGLWGALLFLLSPRGLREVALARTDTLFALLCFLTALLAYRAWERGRGWTLFWFVAGLTTLTKGPLGLLLALGGLAAALWDRRSAGALRFPWRAALPGLALFAALGLGWFALAWAVDGRAVYDKLIQKELVGMAVGEQRGKVPGMFLYRPTLYFLGGFFPASLLTLAATWRAIRRPSATPSRRRFERFLVCYFWIGMAMFSISAHQRQDLLFPLLPAAALLAGHELARWLRPERFARPRALLVGLAVVVLVLLAVYQFLVPSREVRVLQAAAVHDLAERIQREHGSDLPIVYLNTPEALQFHQESFRRYVALDRALELLRGADPAFVAVRRERLEPAEREALAAAGTQELFAAADIGKLDVVVLSNHPRAEWTPTQAFLMPAAKLRWEGLRLHRAALEELRLSPASGPYRLEAFNDTAEAGRLRVEIVSGDPSRSVRVERELQPGERWELAGSAPPAPTPPPGSEEPAPWRLALVGAVVAAILLGIARAILRALEAGPAAWIEESGGTA